MSDTFKPDSVVLHVESPTFYPDKPVPQLVGVDRQSIKSPWAILLCKFSDDATEPFTRDYYEDLFTSSGIGSHNMVGPFNNQLLSAESTAASRSSRPSEHSPPLAPIALLHSPSVGVPKP